MFQHKREMVGIPKTIVKKNLKITVAASFKSNLHWVLYAADELLNSTSENNNTVYVS